MEKAPPQRQSSVCLVLDFFTSNTGTCVDSTTCRASLLHIYVHTYTYMHIYAHTYTPHSPIYPIPPCTLTQVCTQASTSTLTPSLIAAGGLELRARRAESCSRQTHPVGSASTWLPTCSSAPNLILAHYTQSLLLLLLLRLLSFSKMLQGTERGPRKGPFLSTSNRFC